MSVAENEYKAYDFLDQAEKLMRKKPVPFFGNKGAYSEEAAENFSKAANYFKMAKNWDQAGKAYMKQAECLLKVDSKHEAATALVSAAGCLKKTNALEAVEALKKANELFTGEGRFAVAAKHAKEIGEIYEQEADFEKAMENYQQAAEYFDAENSTSQGNQCLLKVAQFSAQLEKYEQAIEIYEKVAKASLDNNLLKWGAKEHLQRACLCYLANGDLVGASKALDNYKNWDASFASSRECKFLDDILKALDANDVDQFTQAVVDYDSISKLDQWKTKVLLKIKQSIQGGGGSELEGGGNGMA